MTKRKFFEINDESEEQIIYSIKSLKINEKSGINKIEKYQCEVHDNDKSVCYLYDCGGKKDKELVKNKEVSCYLS